VDDMTMRRRVREARVGRLATVTPSGAPHVVPCCFALDGDTVYSAVDGKPKSTLALRRLDNVRAHPATALLVDHYGDDWSTLWWIRLDGSARVLDPANDPDPHPDPGAAAEHARALDLLAAKYPQYRAHRPPGAVLAVDVARWRAWSPSP
jgi:PPOX class probable F420-dependent enzyme